jgi:lipoyl(octanoyl) transferase
MPVFSVLEVIDDPTPRPGPAQMALDEALVEAAVAPVLRIFCWDAPAVTFGFGQSHSAVRAQWGRVPLTRRWTGGGVVEHGEDWTFSVVVPPSEPFAHIRPSESYCLLHRALAGALGGGAELLAACPGPVGPPGACFVEPVRADILDSEGRKICGGAQRRTRRGILHQGSLRAVRPAGFLERLMTELAESSCLVAIDGAVQHRADCLEAEKYRRAEWLRRVA